MIRKVLPAIVYLAVACWADAAPLRVASLHPLATDLARQVGGEAVEIVELMKAGQDPHLFMPTPSDLQAAAGVRLVLAMGKGLETYLARMRDTLEPGQEIFEIGRMVPSLVLDPSMTLFDCCPVHSHGTVDPHWWHNPRNMIRAARLLAEAFSQAQPENAGLFLARARAYGRQLDALDQWARSELAKVPPARRRLTTAHASFNYFCEEYLFRAAPVLGLSSLEHPRPGQIRQVLDTLAQEKIPAIFPEITANPAVLETIAREAGVRLGGMLKGDSPTVDAPSYEAMFRHNVETIVAALAPAAEGEP